MKGSIILKNERNKLKEILICFIIAFILTITIAGIIELLR